MEREGGLRTGPLGGQWKFHLTHPDFFSDPLVCFHDRAKASFLDQMMASEQMSVLFSFKSVRKDAYL